MYSTPPLGGRGPLLPFTAAQDEVITTRRTLALCFTTLPSRFRVPSTAGDTRSRWGSGTSMRKGEAVWKTYSDPATAASKEPGASRSASTSSSFPAQGGRGGGEPRGAVVGSVWVAHKRRAGTQMEAREKERKGQQQSSASWIVVCPCERIGGSG